MSTAAHPGNHPATSYDDAALRAPSELMRHSRISWGAILAGTAIAVVVGAALNILGVAIGANLVDAAARDTPDATTLGVGGGVWMVVSHLVGLALGAYAAARLSGTGDRTDGLLHGLAMWATATILAGMLLGSLAGSALSTAGSAVSGVFGSAASGIGSLASAAGGEVSDRTSNDSLQSTAQAAADRVQNALVAPSGDPAQMNSDQRRAEIGQIAARRISDGELSQGDNDRLTALIAAEAGISQDEARGRIQQVEQETQQRLQQAEEQARQAADTAATAAAAAAYWTFALLLLGAIVSAVAARLGTRAVPAGAGAARFR
jgi:hypothetical protein